MPLSSLVVLMVDSQHPDPAACSNDVVVTAVAVPMVVGGS